MTANAFEPTSKDSEKMIEDSIRIILTFEDGFTRLERFKAVMRLDAFGCSYVF